MTDWPLKISDYLRAEIARGVTFGEGHDA